METVDVAVLFLGYVNACSRFYGAGEPVHERFRRDIRAAASAEPQLFGPSIRELGRPAEVDSFMPLFEALHWATSLESRIADDWPDRSDAKYWYRSMPAGATVRGVRFARNRVHHQWAEAFTIADHDRELPLRCVPWIWRPELPDGKPDREGERLYRCELAGAPVIGALGCLAAIFGLSLRHLHDAGVATGDLIEALLPSIDSLDPADFTRDAISSTADQTEGKGSSRS